MSRRYEYKFRKDILLDQHVAPRLRVEHLIQHEREQHRFKQIMIGCALAAAGAVVLLWFL